MDKYEKRFSRPSPFRSAKYFKTGQKKLGQDKTYWYVKKDTKGVKRWARVKKTAVKKPKRKSPKKSKSKKESPKKSKSKKESPKKPKRKSPKKSKSKKESPKKSKPKSLKKSKRKSPKKV